MIETAIKEDLFLDSKLIIPENRMDAIRIMNELHPVVGGQPTNEKNQPNDNNPILDLACTILNIHESGIGVHADLREIQNEPPKYFYAKGFMSGISNLKGNGILAVYGHWRDGSGSYAIKQFYYTDKEIVWRNAISDTSWSQWFDVLTGNSDLDYTKLLNVPITSTLSDDKTKIASIFAVNNVNRAAVNAQKTANTANANAVDAMNEALKKIAPGDFGIGGINSFNKDVLDITEYPLGTSFYWAISAINMPGNRNGPFRVSKNSNMFAIIYYTQDGGKSFQNTCINGKWLGWAESYDNYNVTIGNHGQLHTVTGAEKDLIAVGDYGLGGYRNGEDGYTQVPTPAEITNLTRQTLTAAMESALVDETHTPRSGDLYGGIVIPRALRPCEIGVSGRGSGAVLQYRGFSGHLSSQEDWHYAWGTSNTTNDPDGFLRAFGNAVALTTDKLTSDLKVNRSDLVASAKYAYDVYQAALDADKKAVNAQTTANTGVANAKTAQTRADAAFSKVKPIGEGGTGATTAANARKNLGHGDASTRNVATSLDSHGNTLVPAALSFGFGQKYKDVTAERAFGIPYKNNTQKPIYIMGTGRSNDYAAPITVDGLVVGRIGNGTSSYSFIVLPGSEYMFDKSGFANFSCIEVS